eukprot:5142666-Prymnesium_polylepis.1
MAYGAPCGGSGRYARPALARVAAKSASLGRPSALATQVPSRDALDLAAPVEEWRTPVRVGSYSHLRQPFGANTFLG